MTSKLFEAQEIKKYFPITRGLMVTRVVGQVKAVDGVSFSIQGGETFGLVGESGCGKTTTARLALLLEDLSGGRLFFEGKDLQQLAGNSLRNYRASVQAVFQDPFSSLNPRLRVADIVGEPLVINTDLPRKAIRDRVRECLSVVGLNGESADLYPHEFSGGQRQRIAIARALTLNPKLIVLDEPVSALDVSIRAQVLNLLMDIQEQFGLAFLLIAHDLAVVRYMSRRVGVMYLGRIVEMAASEELYDGPQHPYTHALLSAVLPHHPRAQRKQSELPGEVPSPLNPPKGCHFHPRCPVATEQCSAVEPELRDTGGGHVVACHQVGIA